VTRHKARPILSPAFTAVRHVYRGERLAHGACAVSRALDPVLGHKREEGPHQTSSIVMANMASGELPYHIFVSNSSLLSTTQAAPYSLLLHPNIQYHYQDDSPLELLPRSEDEHVLVLDYDPTDLSQPSAKSISSNIAVTSLKVTDAPGAAASGSDELSSKNDKMYIIHTSTLSTGAS